MKKKKRTISSVYKLEVIRLIVSNDDNDEVNYVIIIIGITTINI